MQGRKRRVNQQSVSCIAFTLADRSERRNGVTVIVKSCFSLACSRRGRRLAADNLPVCRHRQVDMPPVPGGDSLVLPISSDFIRRM